MRFFSIAGLLGVLAGLGVVSCGSGTGAVTGFLGGGGGPDGGLLGDTGLLGRTDALKDVTTQRLGMPDTGSGTGDGSCSKAVTCASEGVQCGPLSNGCGTVLSCGTCEAGTCGGGGKAGVCGTPCVPTTCAKLGFTCGPAGDGCGGMLSCGTCESGTCGGGGTASQCGGSGTCVPTTCLKLGFTCGPAGDGCGGMLDCGTCSSPDVCGAVTPSQCGAVACTPKTCASIGAATCGPVGDGCGSLLQCGACSEPKTCGGLTPGQCGVPATCTGLCLQQTTCASPTVTTTVTGTVYAPNGVDPLPNVLVYIPNSAVAAFTPGVACEQCTDGVTGSPLVSAATDTDGKFTLTNAPVGTKIPLVIQTGRWRRQTVIPSIAACTNTALPACTAATAANGTCLTSLPQTKAQGDIPLMAFATGSIDALECVIRKIGVADSEFTNPGGGGRINLYVGFEGAERVGNRYELSGTLGGSMINSSTPTEDVLVGSATTLAQYDMVLFPCEAGEMVTGQYVYNQQTAAQVGTWANLQSTYQTNVMNYANAGGRIFTTHYSYIWLYNDTPFSTTADWAPNQCDNFNTFGDGNCTTGPANNNPPASWGYPPDQTGYIQTSFPKGLELAQWLLNVGASTTLGQIPIGTLRWDLPANGIPNPPSQLWMQIQDPNIGDIPMHYTFNTPVTAAPANQCGKVLFDDFHVESVPTNMVDQYDYNLDDGSTFPAECVGGAMTPQEKLLEFMIFDLGSCVAPSTPTCNSTTCTAQHINCGPADDGCGNLLQCGTCPAGETCGGGGTPSVCGAPTCTPTTCNAQKISCGPAGDGCGNALSCGTCPAGETCGGGGAPGVCGAGTCTPKTCLQEGISCGPAGDGCGNALSCGTCPAGQTCGGGGKPGVCGSSCTPTTCIALGFNCGPAGDGCGNELSCGTCSTPQTCGGGGTPGVCGGNIPK